MRTSQIFLCDGIGNIIQSIPFIKAVKLISDKVIGVNRADYRESADIVRHLFNTIVPLEESPIEGRRYSIPQLKNFPHDPEYASWFHFHRIPEPERFEINREDVKTTPVKDSVDFILWGGCKPNWKTKQWPYWPELSEILLENYTVGVVGLPGEGGEFPKKVIDYRGKFSLLETGGIIENSKYYIGNEGGLTHYANALQSVMWVIWGGTSRIKNTPPPRDDYHSISLNLECQPCQWRLPATVGCGNYKCLNELTPDIVMNYITKKI